MRLTSLGIGAVVLSISADAHAQVQFRGPTIPLRAQAQSAQAAQGEWEASLAAISEYLWPEDCIQAPFELPDAPHANAAGVGVLPEFDRVYRFTIRAFVIRRSDGTGGMDERRIQHLMRDLNYGFRNHGFVFDLEPEVRYIDNDDHYTSVDDFDEDREIIDPNYEDGVINFFFVPDYHGNTGPGGVWVGPPITSGERAIFFVYEFAGTPTNIVTPAHEMGHVFMLFHPYQDPPECTGGQNCTWASDRVCDTPATPVLFSQNTLATGVYVGDEVPPCRDDPPYDPNTKLYMQAGWDAGHILRDVFTDGQYERMLSVGFPIQEDLLVPRPRSFITDCDANGIDDISEILAGATPDINQDMVPDVCQVFPESGDLLVSGMTGDDFNRPRYFDGDTGAYRGTIWNGMNFAHQLRMGPDGLVYMPVLGRVSRLNLETGRSEQFIIDGKLENASVFVDLLFDSNGDILVLDINTTLISKYDAKTGEFIGVFSDLSPVLTLPKYMEYGPDGNIYVVATGVGGNAVHMFDADLGTYLGEFVSAGAGGLTAGSGLRFHEGVLYVSDLGANALRMYDATTGDSLGDLVSPGAGGLRGPHALQFDNAGNIYVASRNTDSVKWYDDSGTYLGDFVAIKAGAGGGFDGGLDQPTGLLFIP